MAIRDKSQGYLQDRFRYPPGIVLLNEIATCIEKRFYKLPEGNGRHIIFQKWHFLLCTLVTSSSFSSQQCNTYHTQEES